MILSTLAAVAMLNGNCGGVFHPRAPVELIVARAWQDADKEAKKHKADIDRDTEMGKKYSLEVEKSEKVSDNVELQQRLNKVASELSAIAKVTPVSVLWGDSRLNTFDYSFKLLKGDDVNAFSLPGGYIYVYEGLMKYVETDDELAGVIGHEIAHAALRHVATLQREQSKLSTITLPLILIGILSGGGEAGLGAFQLGQLIGQAKGSGWSVQAEDAADYAGFQYVSKSRFSPVGALTFMERLARDERNRPSIDWGIYQTHPLAKERAVRLTGYLEANNIAIRRSLVTTTFRTQVKPGENGVELWFGGRRIVTLSGTDSLERADEAAQRLDNFFDNVPELFQVSSYDGRVYWKNQPVLELTLDDAAASKTDLDSLSGLALKQIRSCLFMLAYRVWDLR
jgi:hypothetical protein